MGWMVPAMMAAGGVLGALGGRSAAAAANRPQRTDMTTERNPYGNTVGSIDRAIEIANRNFDDSNWGYEQRIPGMGPSNETRQLRDQMIANAQGGMDPSAIEGDIEEYTRRILAGELPPDPYAAAVMKGTKGSSLGGVREGLTGLAEDDMSGAAMRYGLGDENSYAQQLIQEERANAAGQNQAPVRGSIYGYGAAYQPGKGWYQGTTAPNQGGGGAAPDGTRTGADFGVHPRGETSGIEGDFFDQQIQALFDPSRLDPANDPTLAPYLDVLKQRAQERLQEELGGIGDEFEMSGMYGGSGRALEAGKARLASERGLSEAEAQALLSSREANLGRQMEALGMVSGRDVEEERLQTSREIAKYQADAQQAAAAGNASAAAAAASRAQDLEERRLDLTRQLELAKLDQAERFGWADVGMNEAFGGRDRQLGAYGQLADLEKFGLGMQGQLSGQLQGDRGMALGAGMDLARLGMDRSNAQAGRLGQAYDASMGYDTMRGNANQIASQIDYFNQGARDRALDQYLSQILPIASQFMTTREHGWSQGPRQSTTAGMLQGLIGGATAGAGLAGSFRGA